MTPESTYLLDMATTIAHPYTQLPTIQSAMVTGSVAKGIADRYSDIDMTMYYADELPSEDELHTIREGLGGSERRWVIGDHAQGSFAEAYELNGIEVQIGHTTIAMWEERIADVLERLDVESSLQKAMEGTLACKALYGEAYIEGWKQQLTVYPPALTATMLKKYLQFFPLWGLDHHFATRDATIWFYQAMTEAAHNIVGVLAGLNQLYFTTFQFKRMRRFLGQMEIKPQDSSSAEPVEAADRLEQLFTLPRQEAALALESLVTDTIALVEQHHPTFDTTVAKRRIGWRHEAWNP